VPVPVPVPIDVPVPIHMHIHVHVQENEHVHARVACACAHAQSDDWMDTNITHLLLFRAPHRLHPRLHRFLQAQLGVSTSSNAPKPFVL